MRTSLKKMTILTLWVGLFTFVNTPQTSQAAPTAADTAANVMENAPAQDGNYSSLTSLVNDICNDAILNFADFFTPASVTVHPFKTLDFPRETSILGVVLADQMLAMVNNETSGRFAMEHSQTETQELTGLIQEMDGYLRIHISGINAKGEKRSHVVAVEMSEPLYRALHATVDPDQLR
ncbi:MAG: hypothetical protein OEL66_07050 [Desulfobulbaceae bacterium]|nr:hypothetical protein [Desulfobulbaceae bacterium]